MGEYLLTAPEPKIELYQQGFLGVCQLGRAADGKKLSNLIERITEPMVIAVDAPWGAGKSVFLKCWVGAHTLENEGKAKTVYFDAFRYDFMDDPLIGLTGVISERVDQSDDQREKWQKAKEAAFKLVRPAIRTGIAVATVGATEYTGAIVGAALEAGFGELQKASEDFWKKEDGRRAAMKGFRDALEKLASEQKLVIVVDELDRCRPDYALSLLEVVKHFFDVPNVHFVLGVNLDALANSVRARYGSGVQGDKYLQKFITVSMPLVPSARRPSEVQVSHFKRISQDIGLNLWVVDYLCEYLQCIDHHAKLSLRDVEKIATLAMVTPEPSDKPVAKFHLFIGILILQVVSPRAVDNARKKQLSEDDVFQIFQFNNKNHTTSLVSDAERVWSLVTWPTDRSPSEYYNLTLEQKFNKKDPRDLLREVISQTLDVFKVIA
ncbi:MAG: hypothetical protein HUJ27_06130 [Rhodobacteraceae bacterium]|nr:hypothetical protein [Paracoccaceae bacterium]